MYAALIKEQMQLRHTSLRKMADEGVLKRSRRAGFFERLEAGSLTIDEFQRVLVHLEIDPIRAGLVLLCYNSASSYEDPCCETTALVAVALAARLPSELAACEGQFETKPDAHGERPRSLFSDWSDHDLAQIWAGLSRQRRGCRLPPLAQTQLLHVVRSRP